MRWSFILSLVVSGIAVSAAAAQTASTPTLHFTIPHPNPQAGATFGWTMAIGNLESSLTSLDDLVVASILEDVGGFTDLGAAYPFIGTSLTAGSQLLPSSPHQNGINFGRLAMAIGDTRGTATSPRSNLLFVPEFFRNYTFTSCPNDDYLVGGVRIFDLASGSSNFLMPPPDPGQSEPCGVHDFGHWVAVGNLDDPPSGAQYNDLIVGAPTANGGDGRVYIFFGYSHFLASPANSWIAIKGPTGGNDLFGASVAAGDIDQDGIDDLVVGATENGSPSQAGGSVYIFKGSQLATLTKNAVYDLTTAVPDQVLTDVCGQVGDWFGWQVYVAERDTQGQVTDLGGPGYGTGSWRPDVMVHAEDSDVVNGSCGTTTPNCGALFVFFGDASSSSGLVNGTPIKLQTPANTGLSPQTGERFGRGAAVTRWKDSGGTVRTGLLVDAPDRDVVHPGTGLPVVDAGAVFLYYAPLDGTGGTDNRWPDFDGTGASSDPLLEPGTSGFNPTRASRFGAWMVSGIYDNTWAGHQLVIAARERPLGASPGVGQVYTYHAP